LRGLMVAAAVVALSAGQATAYRAENGHFVGPLEGERYIVEWRGGSSGEASFWCAASDYAKHSLGLPWQARIWRISEPPRKRGEGVVFSLNSDGAAKRTGITSFGKDKRDRRARANMTIISAYRFCNEKLDMKMN
jgi:hypothetical protein